MNRLLHVSTELGVGSDKTGDGTVARPLLTYGRALELSREGDEVAVDGLVGSIPEVVPAPKLGRLVLATAFVFALVVLILTHPAALAWLLLLVVLPIAAACFSVWLARRQPELTQGELADEIYGQAW